MSTNPADVKDFYADDVKDLKDTVQHLENGSVQPTEIVYPETLKNMSEPPTMEMLQEGFEIQKQESALPLGKSLIKEWKLVLVCMPYLISTIGCGFDNGCNGITTAMPAFLLKFGGFNPVTKSLSIDSIWISLWSSMTQISIAFGAFACSYFLDKFGPRATNFGASVFILPAVAIQVFANSPGMLLAGKMLAGLPNGIFVASAANFVSEASTQNLRPMLSSVQGFCGLIGVTLGIATGFERISYVNSDWLSWRLVLAIQWVFPVITVLGLLFVPTSPAYLVKVGKPAEAAKVIARIYRLTDEAPIRARVSVIQHTVATEEQEQQSRGKASFADLFRDKIDRKRTFLTLGVWYCFNFAGQAFLGSGLYFLQQQGLDIKTATQITLGMLALSGFTNFLTGYCLGRFGRRWCFVHANIFHFLVILVLGLLGFAKSKAAGWAVAVVLNFAICTAQLSTGGSSFALNNELSSLRLRAKTQSLGFFFSYLLAWFCAFVTPYIFQSPGYLGAKTSLIYAATTLIGIVWAFFYLPETNGRTAQEIDLLFLNNVPARKWKTTDVNTLTRERAE